MSYPFYFNNKEYQLEDIEVRKEEYNRYIKNCTKNITKSSIIYFKDIRKKVCLIDDKLYCGDKDSTDYYHEIVEESEEVAKKYEELKEWSISNFFAVENKTLPEHLAIKWINFCDENKGSDLITDAYMEFTKRIQKIEMIEKRTHKKKMKELKKKLEQLKKEEEEKQKEKKSKKFKNECDEAIAILENESEEEEKEYEYRAYDLKKVYKVNIRVAGGGMSNGNSYANIEGHYNNEEDFDNGEEGDIFYCEYGSNPIRKHVGKRIVWGEDDNFNIE